MDTIEQFKAATIKGPTILLYSGNTGDNPSAAISPKRRLH